MSTEIRKSMFRIELADGSLLRIPISKKQSEFIRLVLGIHIAKESGQVEIFDEDTLNGVLLCKENPFPILVKEYQRYSQNKKASK